MTQKKAAWEAGIAYTTYRRYECGGSEPILSDAARIADLFGVSLDYLAGRGGKISSPPGAEKNLKSSL